MRSYRINTDRLINQLVPHYLGGRRIILFLQSCLQPLNSLNESWKEWANEKRMEAAMTSQIILLEYYLNHKFNKYLLDRKKRIVVSDGMVNGVPIYWEGGEDHGSDLVLYHAAESSESHTAFRFKDEKQANSDVSFFICCPHVNPAVITQDELTAMISYHVRRYCIAGKKFKVIYG
jgi:hypothetical protein